MHLSQQATPNWVANSVVSLADTHETVHDSMMRSGTDEGPPSPNPEGFGNGPPTNPAGFGLQRPPKPSKKKKAAAEELCSSSSECSQPSP